MRSFSVVPDEPRDQLAIELIGSDQQLLMVINELLLNGPVKTFDVGVHLGSSGIGMPVSFVQASDLLIEVLHKLRAVIGKNGLKRVRKNIGDDGKELSGSQRRMAVRGPGKGESRVVIGKCDNVTPNTIEKVLHLCRKLHTGRERWLCSLWVFCPWGSFSSRFSDRLSAL